MTDKPDFEHGVYRVMHKVKMGDVEIITESDLIFLKGEPFVVLEWGGSPTNQFPSVKLQLDPSRLLPEGRPGYFLYDGLVEDPRTVH